MDIKDLTIAQIGLGRMGAGIARNIQASGCRFVVYNRRTEKPSTVNPPSPRYASTRRQ